jgi:SAM-dependent methyltransferase
VAHDRDHRSEAFLGGDAIHREWDEDFLGPDLEPLYEALFDRVARGLAFKPGDRVLDAGCGTCLHAARLARRGARVVGVDFSGAALARARAVLARAGLEGRVELQRGSLLALPFRDESFRAASCWGVLMHVPDLEGALAELARVLARGGRLAIMENNAASLHHRVWDRAVRAAKRVLGRPVHEWRRTPRGLEEWREEGGGGLMVRRADQAWLAARCGELGLAPRERFASQFTELYVNLPAGPLRRAVHAWNRRYAARDGDPRLALGNVALFEKH